MPHTHTYPFLADLLSTLEQEGFPMGTSKHLQVQELVRLIPDELPLQDWRSYLSPLFARSEAEQQHFQEVFTRVLARWQRREEPTKTKIDPGTNWKLIGGITLGVLLLLGLFFIWNSLFPPSSCPNIPDSLVIQGESGDTLQICLPERFALARSITYAAFGDGQMMMRDTTSRLYAQIDTQGCVLVIVPYDVTSEVLPIKLGTLNCLDSLELLIDIISPKIQDAAQLTDVRPPLLSTIPLPHTRDITRLQIPAYALARKDFYDRHLWWIKGLGILLIGFIFFAGLRRNNQKRQKAIAELAQRDQPPFIWQIPLDPVPEPRLSATFPQLLNQLRRRGVGSQQRVDIPETVKATARKAGRLELQYRSLYHSPDYLLLINRQTQRDHQARLYDYLYHQFREQEIHMRRFFYNGDPRLCWNEDYPQGISLQQLAQRHGDHRLIVISHGAELLNPVTGRPARWTRLFQSWNQRLMLSPQPWSKWGSKERRIQTLFQLMPASLQSLSLAVQQWNAGEPLPGDWERQMTDAQEEPITLQGSLMQTLRQHYDEPMINWIAACAIYPALQWELTCHLGEYVDPNLLNIRRLRELCRLPWFVEGKIPDAARAALLDSLSEEEEYALRQHVLRLFQELPAPPENSAAYEDYALALILNELYVTKDRQRKKELEEDLRNHLAAGAEVDWVTLRSVKGKKGRTDFTLPEEYVPAYTQRNTTLKHTFLAIGLMGLLTAVVTPLNDDRILCEGDRITFDEIELCLSDWRDSLVYYEFAIRHHLEAYRLDQAENLEDSVISFRRQWRNQPGADTLLDQYTENIVVSYYNAGVHYAWDKMDLSPQSAVGNKNGSSAYGRENTFGDNDATLDTLQRFQEVLTTQQIDTVCRRYWIAGINKVSPVTYEGNPYFDQITIVTSQYCAGMMELTSIPQSTDPVDSIQVNDTSSDFLGIRDDIDSLEVQQGLPGSAAGYSTVDTLQNLNQIVIQGRITDQNGYPISGAMINLVEYRTRTNSQGVFRLSTDLISDQLLKALPLEVNANGYEPYREAIKMEANRANRVELDDIRLQAGDQSRINTEPIIPEMVAVEGGNFLMGSPEDEPGRFSNETLHRVTLSNFAISKYEVTNAEYVRFLNARGNQEEGGVTWIDLEENDIQFEGEVFTVSEDRSRHPVTGVSWYGASAYCNWLNEVQAGGRTGWRLPTEAQWEYAAGGGPEGYDAKGVKQYIWAGTSDESELERYAWYKDNSISTYEVGTRLPNPLGIYDMSGNVFEWVSDWYDGDYYQASDGLADPPGPDTGSLKVVRGGSWFDSSNLARVSDRLYFYPPSYRDYYVGFRLCRY